MFLTHRQDSDVERAWHDFAETIADARSDTLSQAKSVLESAAEAVGDTRREARQRMVRANDALHGRQTPPRWGMVAGALAAGFLVGIAGVIAAQLMMRRNRQIATSEVESRLPDGTEILSSAEREEIVRNAGRRSS